MEEKSEITGIVIFPYAEQMREIVTWCRHWEENMKDALAALSSLFDAIAEAFGQVIDEIKDSIGMIASDDCQEKENWPSPNGIYLRIRSVLSHRMRIKWYTGGFL